VGRKPNPLPYGLRNPYGNLKSENSQDYVCMLRNLDEIVVNEFGFWKSINLG
jgi:hypothetical protein